MKTVLLVVAAVLAVTVGAQELTAGKASPGNRDPIHPATVMTGEKTSKLSSDLRALVRRHRDRESPNSVDAEPGLVLASDTVIQIVVETTVDEIDVVDKYLRAAGGRIETTARNLVLARVPISGLDALANAGPEVQVVRRPRQPVPFRTTSEGVGVIGATAWHASGRRGGGVKVAILDVGFDGYRTLMGNELPQIPDARVRSFSGDITGDASGHGTAVAEIVHDVAPDSILYLVNFSNEVELENAVDWLIQEGVDVINTSWGFPCGGPLDGTGSVNDLVKRAADAGILWVAAAGNFAQKHWMGDFQDSNADKWHNFSPTEEGNRIYMESGDELRVCVEWDDWTIRNQDLDLYVWNSAGSVVASSDDPQSGASSHDPLERLEFSASSAGDYFIGVKRYSGARNLKLHLFTYEPGEECAVEAVVSEHAAPKGIVGELRRFRDEILSPTPAGQELIRLYYRHSREVRRILFLHPGLGIEAAQLVNDLRPAVRSVLDGGFVRITEDQGSRIDAFVNSLAALAGPELHEALVALQARAAISTASGQTAAGYWNSLLKGETLRIAANNYPEAGYMFHTVEQSSLLPPADSAFALTIGATSVSDGSVRDFSSQGPTADGRLKPDLVAPDGVCTTTYGGCGTGGFVGTSAAAPHAAGAVALVWNAYPSLDNSEVRAFLVSRATDVGPVGPDNVTGAGRLALEATGPDVFAPPTLSGPNGSGVPLSPTFNWHEVAGATSYRLMIATSAAELTNDPASQSCNFCVLNTTRPVSYHVLLSSLLPDTTYYWQVQATAGSKKGWWAQSSFTTTTAPELTAPSRPDLAENPGTGSFATRAVIITHGYWSDAASWVKQMAIGVCDELDATVLFLDTDANPPADSFTRVCTTAQGWDVWVVDWRDRAGLVEGPTIVQGPWDALVLAALTGEGLASRIVVKNYNHVHFIAHSAGSNLIQTATTRLKQLAPGLKIHETFLDAYDNRRASAYGVNADWADNYVDTRPVLNLYLGLDGTKWFLDYAFNVDVTVPSDVTCWVLCRHSRPYRFYVESVIKRSYDADDDPIGGRGGMGFDLSIEKRKTLSTLTANYPRSMTCTMTDGTCDYAVLPPRTRAHKNVRASQFSARFDGPVTFTAGTTSLFDTIMFGPSAPTTSAPRRTGNATAEDSTAPPAWIVADISTMETVHALRFNWRFGSDGEGFLRVFVDGRLVRELDQRHVAAASLGSEDVSVGGPEGMLEPGAHSIVFRLDGFGGTPTSVELTEVELIRIESPTRGRAVRH